MRNVQSTGSCGGKKATDPLLIWQRRDSSHDWCRKTVTTVGAPTAFVSGAEPFLASGWVEGAVFFGDVTQQVMLAQQRG